jgi:NAD(P)H-hydrate epimerase
LRPAPHADTLPVAAAADAAAADAATIAAGVPSRALMQRAGAAAAAEIARRHADRLADGVLLLAGAGNNGGDAWVVARALAAAGVRCTVHEAVEARTPDALAERALALPLVARTDGAAHAAGVVVDGLLGTGAAGAPRGAIAAAVAGAAALRERGTAVVALDVPSGVDATTGAAEEAIVADLTLTFGVLKRGLLVARGHCGAIVVLDIGLAARADAPAALPELAHDHWALARVPAIAPDAHKGSRRKLAVVGGSAGMAGAAALAARAALASGIGMVRIVAAAASVPALQAALPEALAAPWPADTAAMDDLCAWADALLVGPGLGRSDEARALLDRTLERWRGPVVLDADALTLFEGRTERLAALLAGRAALLTPHPVEFARLAAADVTDVLARRFDAGAELAGALGASVLLKGVPTVVSGPDGRRLVTATGTPVLAAGGSGDLLAGIAATLLAQHGDATEAGACAAWAHGRAAELAGAGRVRGVTVDDVAAAIGRVWAEPPRASTYPVLLELPAVP